MNYWNGVYWNGVKHWSGHVTTFGSMMGRYMEDFTFSLDTFVTLRNWVNQQIDSVGAFFLYMYLAHNLQG